MILGGSEMHIDVGSTINLTCIIQHTPEPPDYVFWTHNQQVILLLFFFFDRCELSSSQSFVNRDRCGRGVARSSSISKRN